MEKLRPIGLHKFGLALTSAAVIWLFCTPAMAQYSGRVVVPAPDSQTRIDQLAADVERAQSLRSAKALQILYSQYEGAGLWNEAASLFSDNAEILSGDDNQTVAKGKAAIADYLNKIGGRKQGLAPGALYNDMIVQPVITLSYDGNSATGRWSEFAMTGTFGGDANWSGGMQVNDYVREKSVWKIRRIHLYPQFAGSYEKGFFAQKLTFPIVPYPYSPARAGRPVPDLPSGVDVTLARQPLAQIEAHLQAMNDEDTIRNLQAKYGYYIDRKMWSDVTDLFASDGVLELAGQGVWMGVKSIRRALEVNGPEGLQRGQSNDQIQIDMLVSIEPGGTEARMRGVQLAMLSPKLGEAAWGVSIFENRYVKGADGLWRIREMRLYPQMKADYYQGWNKSKIVDPTPRGPNTPDKPSAADNAPITSGAIPAFFDLNPVTGKPVSYPEGVKVVGADRLVPAPILPAKRPFEELTLGRLIEARRKLDVSKAYDAVENANNTFGYYLDDMMWDEMAEDLSVTGNRTQGAGFYVGHDHVYRAMVEAHTDGPASETNPRDHLQIHQRLQPVIDVAPDAKTAKIRTRLFLYSASSKTPGSFSAGMYPNDTAVNEDGVWKMDVAGEIDEPYVTARSYKDGWAKPPAITGAPVVIADPVPIAPDAPGAPPSRRGQLGNFSISNTMDFPPDYPWTWFADFRRDKAFYNNNWPDIKPMWFAYRNPVSGRTPPFYCAEILKCYGYR